MSAAVATVGPHGTASIEEEVRAEYASYPVGRTGGGLTYVNVSDSYVELLSYAVPGMLNRGNLLAFDYALGRLPAGGAVVEIGVFAGLSTSLLAYYRRKHGVRTRFFNCDRWLFEGFDEAMVDARLGDSAVTQGEYRRFVRESYQRNVKMFAGDDVPHTIELFSDEFFEAWGAGKQVTDVFGRRATLGGGIGFCYIDGDHRYGPSMRDFENVDRFLLPGGFILFDDSAGSKFECGKVAQEAARRPGYRLVVRNPNYLIQKVG